MNTIERITELLNEKNISAAKMMKELGFSSGLFSQWKSGKQNPSAEKISKIADYLGVSTDYLLGNETTGAKPTDEDIKFALFDGSEGVTDEMYDEVKRFAKYIKEQNAAKQKEKI